MSDDIIIEKSGQRWFLAIIALAVFTFCLDYGMVNISLPAISTAPDVLATPDARISLAARLPLVWLVVLTCAVPAFAALGDRKGHKGVFIWGMGIFAAASLGAAFSPNLHVLVAARAGQAIGESMFIAAGMGLVAAFVPHVRKTWALRIVGIAVGLGFAAGSALGAVITDAAGWHRIFLPNVGLAAVAIVLAIRFIPRREASDDEASPAGFDLLGAVLLLVGLAAVTCALSAGTRVGWSNTDIVVSLVTSTGCIVAFVACLVLFLARQATAGRPFMEIRLFGRRDFALGSAAGFVVFFLLVGVAFLFPFYLRWVRGLALSETGLIMMTPWVAMVLVTPLAAAFAERAGSRMISSVGTLVASAALVMCFFLDTATRVTFIAVALALLGVGGGLFIWPNRRLVVAHAPVEKADAGFLAYVTVTKAGAAVGLAALTGVATQGMLARLAQDNITFDAFRRLRAHEAVLAGFHAAFAVAVLLALLALVLSIVTRDAEHHA